MSALNKIAKPVMVENHNGLSVKQTSNLKQLKRTVLACMLWEDTFYVDGESIADQISYLVSVNKPSDVEALATEARNVHNLRHVPLLLLRELARNGKLKADTLNSVIQRADELSEFLSIYWKDGKTPISNQVKLGLSKAFLKFNEYQFAKWDKNSAQIRLRDVMFLVRPKPETEAQANLFKKIANSELTTPDTWEVQLSAGADKRETFARLMTENKLGALAFLRNLRNMTEAGVSSLAIESYAATVDTSKVLPFRYMAAYRTNPQYKNMLGRMLLKSLQSMSKLKGKTVLLVDVSGSMDWRLSKKSDLTRMDAATSLAILCRGICEDVTIYTFSDKTVKVGNPIEGFDLADQVINSQYHSGTRLGKALTHVNATESYDRLIVFTDEQSSDRISAPKSKSYIVNVATDTCGLNHGAYVAIDGFSENVIRYMQELENQD